MRGGVLRALLVLGLGTVLGGCFQPMKPTEGGHLTDQPPAVPGAIPPPVQALPVPPRPKPTAKLETYSVVVNNVNVRELLFALARDAKVNVDIHPGITGAVTLNAIDQTLPQLLSRISKQVDMRYELDGPNLAVMPDSPFLRIYKIDYVNMEREMQGQVSVSSEIVGQQTAGAGGAGGGRCVGWRRRRAEHLACLGPEPQREPVLGEAHEERRGDSARDRQGLAGRRGRGACAGCRTAGRRNTGPARGGRSRRRCAGARPERDVPRGVVGDRKPRSGGSDDPGDTASAREAPGVPRPGPRQREAPGLDRGHDRRRAAQQQLPAGNRLQHPAHWHRRHLRWHLAARPRRAHVERPLELPHPRLHLRELPRELEVCSKRSGTCACSRRLASRPSTTRRRC